MNANSRFVFSGFLQIADDWTFGGNVSHLAAGGGFDMSLATWQALPLAAQQLLRDRLDVWAEGFLEGMVFVPARDALSDAAANGVQFHEYPTGQRHLADAPSRGDTRGTE